MKLGQAADIITQYAVALRRGAPLAGTTYLRQGPAGDGSDGASDGRRHADGKGRYRVVGQ
jgi:hypothetical protein